VLGCDDERDHPADGDPRKRDIVQIELVEKALDRLDEQLRRIVRLGNVGKSVTGVIRRVAVKDFASLGTTFSKMSSRVLSVWRRARVGPLPVLM
jgi:hypothetical protein